jgi:hypothetical protein
MIVEMGDYAWSEHIVTVFLAYQITIKNVQVQLTVKGKTTPDSYTPTPKSSCAQNGVVSTGLMKVVICCALPTVVQGFGAIETRNFRTTTFWAQLLLGVGV